MNAEEVQNGCPYGGVGFVCRPVAGLTYKPIDFENDRITGLQVISNGKVYVNVIGVYLPYYDGTPDQIAHYSETLDYLQLAISDCGNAPVILCGDMNAPLPQQKKLSPNWYRQHPFNQQSLLLYDFMINNELCVGNFAFNQPVNFTYTKGNHKSYIDHVLIPRYCLDKLSVCEIAVCQTNGDEWTSDHLPLTSEYVLSINEDGAAANITSSAHLHDIPKYPRVKWDDDNIKRKYCEYVNELLNEMPMSDISIIGNAKEGQQIIDEYCEMLTTVMHSACSRITEDNNVVRRQNPGQVPWWSRDCTAARDRTRFWYRIWCQCGRPNTGQVYHCYKAVKKTYRQVRRQAMSSHIRTK